MTSSNLTQIEANRLLELEKRYEGDKMFDYPDLGGHLRLPLISTDESEAFWIDITRSYIELIKNSFQNRARKVVILARVDIGGAPHRNPDGEEIQSPHIHLYREGYQDKWAYSLPDSFSDATNAWQTLQDFMNFCNIIKKPEIERGLST